jgi:hypothetical protein
METVETPGAKSATQTRKSMAMARIMGFACLSLLWMNSCRLPSVGSYPVRVFSQSIELAWDPPDEQSLPPGMEIAYYYVYVRHHGVEGWRLIAQVAPSARPEIALNHSDFGNGEFDFAVNVVTSEGTESAPHSSFDVSADPIGGWYLIWYE